MAEEKEVYKAVYQGSGTFNISKPKRKNGKFGESEKKKEKDIIAIYRGLCRLYFREADWDGSWWGTRPDTSGPYYKTAEWDGTQRVQAVLKSALTNERPEVIPLRHLIAAVGAIDGLGPHSQNRQGLLDFLSRRIDQGNDRTHEGIRDAGLPLLHPLDRRHPKDFQQRLATGVIQRWRHGGLLWLGS